MFNISICPFCLFPMLAYRNIAVANQQNPTQKWLKKIGGFATTYKEVLGLLSNIVRTGSHCSAQVLTWG